MSPFLSWGDFHARSRFARSTIPEEKWGTTRSLCYDVMFSCFFFLNLPDFDVEQVNVHAEARREGSRTELILSSSFRK